MKAVKPPRLKKGDLIGLVSPAGTPSPSEKVEGSVRYLERLGYRVRVGENAEKVHGYLAGTDEERAADFNAMACDPEVKAIFALRGGYGTPRILNRIEYAALRRRPKIISGFSDITALQLAIYRKCRLVTFSGPMPAVEFWKDPDPYTEENFWSLLTSKKKKSFITNPADDPLRVLRSGAAQGVLLGGNLSLVVSLFGTPWLPSLRDSLLVLEEVEEAPYRLDRMLTQLINSGDSACLAGLVLGKFTRCQQGDPKKPGFSTDEVLADFARACPVPAVANFAWGHVPKKLTVPFGVRARLDAGGTPAIELLEAAVE